MDEFEQFLKSQPLREVPPAWRNKILAEAVGHPKPMPTGPWWRAWLWPSPYAWGALAAVWIAIFVINSADPSNRNRSVAAESLPSGPGLVALLDERRREWNELLSSENVPVEAPTAPPPPVTKPGACLERADADKLLWS